MGVEDPIEGLRRIDDGLVEDAATALARRREELASEEGTQGRRFVGDAVLRWHERYLPCGGGYAVVAECAGGETIEGAGDVAGRR